MPIILGIFAVLPLVIGMIVQFSVQSFLKKKFWWLLPTVLGGVISTIVVAVRLHAWNSSISPLTQLLFVPGLPALFLFLGIVIGHKLQNKFWNWWNPRIIP